MAETGAQGQPDEVTIDLLVKQVVEGLLPDERRALDALDSAPLGGYARDLEMAAAAAVLAGLGPLEQPPAALRDRLLAAAASHANGTAATSPTSGTAAASGDSVPAGTATAAGASTARVADFVPRPAPPRRPTATGWWAAAACLVLAAIGWMRSPEPAALPPPQVNLDVPPPVIKPVVPPPPAPPTPAEQRDALLAKSGVLKIPLGATKDPAGVGVSADVVWDPETQQGFVHFTGLAANDPQLRQYQLWIFDGARDKRYPVDGGVFDVPAGAGELVVPIRASLPVMTAKAFAVTVEKPGGTVVSGREHVVALGAVG